MLNDANRGLHACSRRVQRYGQEYTVVQVASSARGASTALRLIVRCFRLQNAKMIAVIRLFCRVAIEFNRAALVRRLMPG